MTAVAAAIAAKSRMFEEFYNSGDAAGLVENYFASDADAPFASPPGGQAPVRGRFALVDMFAAMIPDAPAIRLETIDIVASGNVAFEFGRAHLTLADGVRVKGRYCVCWIERNGDWRVKTDMFAADGWEDHQP